MDGRGVVGAKGGFHQDLGPPRALSREVPSQVHQRGPRPCPQGGLRPFIGDVPLGQAVQVQGRQDLHLLAHEAEGLSAVGGRRVKGPARGLL